MKKVLYLFGELNDDDLDWIITQGVIEKIPPGNVLIKEGEPSDFFYIVFEGSVIVSVDVLGSSREITSLGSGEVMGEMSFIDGYPPSASIETREESLVLSLSRLELTERLHHDLGFASRFYRAIALFLSSRLRLTLTELNQGKEFVQPELELSPVLLDAIPHAQARFDWLLRRAQDAIRTH